MTIDLAKLNSATKYPSIPTYHELDPKNGSLLERPVPFTGEDVILTEKVDGTNARIIVMPDGDYYIGSREELLTAKGDRVWTTQLGIVDALKGRADQGLLPARIRREGMIKTYYLEVYGGGIGQGYKNYTTSKTTAGYRLFDISYLEPGVLELDREQIANWRDHGGQEWAAEDTLQFNSVEQDIPLVPRISMGGNLPTTVAGTLDWLQEYLPKTNVALDDTGRGQGEGIVIRTADRRMIAKARFQDYERTMRRREK